MMRTPGFTPSAGITRAPRSKGDLAELTDERLRELAPQVGVDPSGTRESLIQRISETGVALVASKANRPAGDPNDPMYDPDAQAIADESLSSLPANHPGWSDTIAPEILRAPNQVDEAPTADHRAPEGREAGVEMAPGKLSGRAATSMAAHDGAVETEVHGEFPDDPTVMAAGGLQKASGADADADEAKGDDEPKGKGKG